METSSGEISKVRHMFTVVPDNEMREMDRTSLNRMPDPSDWEPGNRLTDILREMNQPITIHRKAWEYALCIEGLERLGMINSSSSAIATGAGTEPPLFYFTNRIKKMVATDLYENPDHEGKPEMLADPSKFAYFPYVADRLSVYRMGGDALDFPDSSFDFAFCLSSIEHFGSRETQRAALNEMRRVVKLGGIICIITELILTDHEDLEYFRWEQLDEMFLQHPGLKLVGGGPDLRISESAVKYPIDLINSKRINRSPHIVLKRGDMLWTSFSMFLQKTEVAAGTPG